MGLNITSLVILGGLVTIENLYGHARDIRVTKDEEGKFAIECNFFIYKNTESLEQVRVMTIPIQKSYDNDFLTKTWTDTYTLVKEVLDARGIEYTDAI